MGGVSCVMTEDQFLCSICLEVFTDPVTTPCGHSFCKICINEHWDNSTHCQCPLCKEDFSARPQLKIITFISEIVTQVKKKPQNENLELFVIQVVDPTDVSCDVCSGVKVKALKSCLVCLASYCQNHLEHHLTIPRLMRHQLIDPVENLEDRICTQHDKPLELFCRNDFKFICLQCISTDHKYHDAVPLKEKGEEEQANVKKMIKERQLKIEKIQRSVELSQKNAEQEMDNGVKIYKELINCVQQSLDGLKQDIEEKHKKTEEQAQERIQELETEIAKLEERRAEMEHIWCSGDHLHFLQTFKSDKPAPIGQDWTEVRVRVPSYEGTVTKAVAELRDRELHGEIKKVLRNELRRVQQFSVEVTLDPDTANPNLALSYDHKQVYHSDKKKYLPDNPKRFSLYRYVVGKQKFSSGLNYFEVNVRNKTMWFIGVVKESVPRKTQPSVNPDEGYWLISLQNDKYRIYDFSFTLDLKSTPKKIGVFVDYEEGIVSFYDVNTAELIHSYTNCCFTEDLLPFFSPGHHNNGENSAPLVLTPVTV